MSEQKETLRKAEASLQDAEKRLAMVRKWQPLFRQAVLEYHGSIQRMKDLAAGDVPRAVNLLTRIIDALEAYLRVAPPSGLGLAGSEPAAEVARPGPLVSIATRSSTTMPPRLEAAERAELRPKAQDRAAAQEPDNAKRPARRDDEFHRGAKLVLIDRAARGSANTLSLLSRGESSMPNAKVLAGSTRLNQTVASSQDQWLVTEATWGDSVRQRFEERYLAPLEPAVDSAINGMQKMAEVLDQVRRDCSDRSESCEHHDDRPANDRPRTGSSSAPAPRDLHRAGDPQARAQRSCSEILRLVAERADAEAKVEGERNSTERSTADSEYARKRATPDRKARAGSNAKRTPTTRSGGGRSSTPRSRARPRPRPSSPPASRKIATLFDSRATSPRTSYDQAKNRGRRHASTRARKRPPRNMPSKTKPIDDSARLADSIRDAPGRARRRLHASSSSIPKPPRRRASRTTKFSDPGDELFTRLSRMEPPLKLLEGLIIPKSMKGGREAWVFILVILPLVGLAMLLDWASTGIGGGRVAGVALAVLLAHLAGQALQGPARAALHAAHALAGRRRRLNGAIAAAWSTPGSRRNASAIAARRDEELKRAEDNYRKAFAAAEAHARRKAAQDQRGLRRSGWSRSRRPSSARCATPSTRTTAAWPSCKSQAETSCRSSKRSTRQLKEQIATRYETAWRRWPSRWREGMQTGGGGARCDQPRGRPLLPAWDDAAWAAGRCRGSSRP